MTLAGLDFSPIGPGDLIWIQAAVAALIVILAVGGAVATVKPEDAGQHKWRAVGGAGIEGALVAAALGFLMMPNLIGFSPLRMKGANELFTWQAQAMLLPGAAIMAAAQNGLFTHAPGLAFFLRPHRRAILARRKAALDAQIAKLDKAGARAGAALDEEALVPPHRIGT